MRKKIYKSIYITDENLKDASLFKLYKSNYTTKNIKIIFKDYEYNIEALTKLYKLTKKGIIFDNYILVNYTDEIIDALKCMFIKDEYTKYKYIYDKVCDRLDDAWKKYNPCKFCQNKCISTRHKNNYLLDNGCCYEFNWSNPKKKKVCRYLGETGKCTIKNISCKLFVCDYLNYYTKFRVNIDEILLINVFLNRKQMLVIKYNYFTKEEDILNKLMEKNKMPYLVYLLSKSYIIRRNLDE